MKTGITVVLNVALLAASVGLLVGPAPLAAASPQDGAEAESEATEDILYLNDGRILRGQIMSEEGGELVFEFVDSKLGMRATLTFQSWQIDRIERDVAVEVDEDADEEEAPRPRRRAESQPDESRSVERTFGTRRGAVDEESLPSFYVVPISGQMGTDIHVDVFKTMVEDIRQHDPDYVIIEMKCLDAEDRLYSRIEENEQSFHGSTFLDKYREVLNFFHDELRDMNQVLWIHDSLGMSSVLALSWPDLYMTPDARLGGVEKARGNFEAVKNDENTYGKYREAYMAWLKGFVEYGGYDLDLIDAMVRPEFALSATWKGRDVDWTLDETGEYVVDQSDERTVTFSAKHAEDFCISDGTAETMDDLALMLGLREYRVVEGEAEEIFEEYKGDWRQAFENCKGWYEDYQKFMGWAGGEDAVKYLGQAKKSLERMISAMERYEAVEIRLGTDLGIRKFDLITAIELIQEQLRALRQGGRGAGGGGRGGGGSGLGGGGGGRR